MDPDSPAFIVYHDHSYFIRHESINAPHNSSTDHVHQRKSSISDTKSTVNIQTQLQQKQQQTCPSSVQVLNRFLLEHQQKIKTSSSDPSSTLSSNTIDFSAIFRALLAKQGHHMRTFEKNVNGNTENNLSSSTSTLQSVLTSQLQPDSSSTATS